MNVQDFAGKIKAKYPQYNSLSDQELTNKVIAKYPQYKSQVQVTPEDKLTGVAKGITNVTQNIGGFAKDVGLGGPVDLVAHSGPAEAVQHATGVNPLLNSQTLQQEQQQPLQNIAGDVGGAAATLGGGELLGLGVKAAPLLTKAGAAARTSKAVQAATAAGKTAKWEDIANEVKRAVKSQYGNSVEHTNAVNKFLAQESPAKLGKNVTKTPQELLMLRKQILARSGTGNIIQKLMNVKTTEDQVAGVARNVVSKYVHQLAPDSQAGDKAYTMWKKIGGSPAEWAARAAIGGTVGKGLKQLGIPESGTTDAILTLLAGRVI